MLRRAGLDSAFRPRAGITMFSKLATRFDRSGRTARNPHSKSELLGTAHACVAEPLEERLLMALARAAGGSGYSGTLSTNTAIRQQQLICDPAEPAAGSTSVQYEAD